MRNIPDDNLAYPVLLKFDNGSSGSSFFLRTDARAYLITAKHVLFDSDKKLRGKKITLKCQTKNINDDRIITISVDLEKNTPLVHQGSDIAAVEIASINASKSQPFLIKYHEGVIISENADAKMVIVNADNGIKLLKDVLISNDVFLYGYPTSLGIKGSPQFDYSKPLLRKGIVANTYKETGTIILDCPVYYGNSGGPVVEVEQERFGFHHKVIGVVSQFIPFVEHWENKQNGLINTELSNSGYSVVVSMDKVFELIHYTKSQ